MTPLASTTCRWCGAFIHREQGTPGLKDGKFWYSNPDLTGPPHNFQTCSGGQRPQKITLKEIDEKLSSLFDAVLSLHKKLDDKPHT